MVNQDVLLSRSRKVRRAVEGHFDHPHGREWVKLTDRVNPLMADIVGSSEAAFTGTEIQKGSHIPK